WAYTGNAAKEKRAAEIRDARIGQCVCATQPSFSRRVQGASAIGSRSRETPTLLLVWTRSACPKRNLRSSRWLHARRGRRGTRRAAGFAGPLPDASERSPSCLPAHSIP